MQSAAQACRSARKYHVKVWLDLFGLVIPHKTRNIICPSKRIQMHRYNRINSDDLQCRRQSVDAWSLVGKCAPCPMLDA